MSKIRIRTEKLKYIFWLLAWVPALIAAWQLSVDQPWIPPLVCGVLLLVTGLISGLRISADSVHGYMSELQRKNRYLAELCTDLAQHNLTFLHCLLSEKGNGSEYSEKNDDATEDH